MVKNCVVKKNLFVLIFLFALLLGLPATSGTYTLRFIYFNSVAKNSYLFFTDASEDKKSITTQAMNISKTLSASDVQVYLGTTTNMNTDYYISLTFGLMYSSTDTEGKYYKAQVWSTDGLTSKGIADVKDSTKRSVKFLGDKVEDATKTSDFYYPISFQFSDYIGEYDEGSYSATITAEVTSE